MPRSAATSHKLTNQTTSLAAEKAKSDALLLSIGQGVIATNHLGQVDRVNQVALDLLGFTAKELIGKWYPKTVVATDESGTPIETTDRPITKAFLTGKSVSTKFFYRRKDKTLLPVILTVSPILMDGKPIGAVEVFRDYSHDLEIERAKDEFISLASHQLRTPLTAIRIYSEMLTMGYAGELAKDQKRYLAMIGGSITRMASMIDSLLNIARIEAGSVVLRLERNRLDVLLNEIVSELRPRIEEKGVKLDVQTIDSPIVTTDQILVKEILSNLLTNAYKYTPKGGYIKVAFSIDNNMAIYKVKDSGLGIPKSEQNQIFTKFYRASNITSHDTTGTGIGLYLVKRLATYLGGEIWFKSEEKKGSTFYFSLPLKKRRAAQKK